MEYYDTLKDRWSNFENLSDLIGEEKVMSAFVMCKRYLFTILEITSSICIFKTDLGPDPS